MTDSVALQDNLFHMMVEQNSIAILLTDKGGNILHANKHQLTSSGYALAELVGRNASMFSAGETTREVYDGMWSTIIAGRIWHGELTNRRKNGELCRELVTISPIRDAAGEISHFFATKEENIFGNIQNLLGGTVATVDPLTGFPNRAMLLDRIGNLLRDAKSTTEPFTVFAMDIDQFRTLNESIGHVAADELLTRTAARLQQGLRQSDTVARIGSNEFAVLLAGDDSEAELEHLARRLLLAVATPVTLEGGAVVAVTASIGIARYPLDAQQADTLLQNADAAMAAAKNEGGDGFHFYAPPVAQLAKAWDDLSEALRDVTRRDELVLHYQPKVDLRSGQIIGLEALVRWQHPEQGLLAPSRFIQLAEETGLIVNLSQWVIRRVLQQLQVWQNTGRRGLVIGVNLSLRHFRSGNLPEFIAAELAATGVDPSLLELEISESTMMRDPTQAFIIVDRIKALGVRLALDDFGTGLSSLSYLSRLNVDKIKIDQSFVRDITSNPVNASIVAAIIAMGHKLGKRVIAVGVESEGQALQLRRNDCDELQGFYFSRPGTAADMEALFAESRNLSLRNEGENARTLLLVDDEPSILNALKRLLRREGYTVLTAEGGEAALEILATHPAQVIVSDQRMPGMSGVELLSRVRELYPDTRRIILSGYSDISTLSDAINRGAVWKFIAKPWDDEALKAEIGHAFALTA
jgi:diguanylate cyclase (GGDEF)-like protein/PAS domain S-box-containing protein